MFRHAMAAQGVAESQHVGCVDHGVGVGPTRATTVCIEDASGAFLPSHVHAQVLRQQEKDRTLLRQALSMVTFWDSADDDAAFYATFYHSTMTTCRRVLQLLAGLCAGMSLYLVLTIYTDSDNSESSRFLATYASTKDVMQKVFMSLGLVCVVLSAAPFAHDAAAADRRTAVRHIASVHAAAFMGALIATIVLQSIEQSRTETEMRRLPGALVSRMHVAVLIRAALHVVGWISMLWVPRPLAPPEPRPFRAAGAGADAAGGGAAGAGGTDGRGAGAGNAGYSVAPPPAIGRGSRLDSGAGTSRGEPSVSPREMMPPPYSPVARRTG